jgi:hypothetical protein
MRLSTASGEPFATGETRLDARPAFVMDRLPRVFLPVEIAGLKADAVVDTGGAYLILNPEVAAALPIGAPIQRDQVVIRGFVYPGMVHRVPIRILAELGEPLQFEATAFVPELEEGDAWRLPSYLGWQGCLERIRLAFDPGRERAYFGELE